MSSGGSEYAAKSLCDLATRAKQRGFAPLQLEWTARAVDLQPDDEWAWAQHGDALLGAGRLDEAPDAYGLAVRFGQTAVGGAGRAEVLKAMGRFQEALDAYEGTRAAFPQDAVARNGYAAMLVLLERFDDALEVLPTGDPIGLEDWIARHIRGMIHLRSAELEKAVAIFEYGVAEASQPASRDYFRTSLSIARLQQQDPAAATELLAEVETPEIQTVATAILIHAYGLMGAFERAATAYRLLAGELVVRQLKEELYRRFVARSGRQHDDAWLFRQEAACVLAASQPS